MSEVKDAFERIKASVENALQIANPAQALKEAEHAFMEVLAKAHIELAYRVAKLEAVAAHPVVAVEGEAKSLLGKVEDFVGHLVQPEVDDLPPVNAPPAVDSTPSA